MNGPSISGFQGSLLSKQFLGYKNLLCSYASTSTLSVPSSPAPCALRLSSGREVPILVVGPASSLGLRVNASLNATPTCSCSCSYLGRSHHQADACHMASVYLGFRSIWNTHFCLRLQAHLYPILVVTRLGRDVRPNSDISQRMSSPTPPSETRNYC